MAHHWRNVHPDAKVQDKPAQATAVLKFEWAYKGGDKTADDLTTCPASNCENGY
jgi:hypothetical protein